MVIFIIHQVIISQDFEEYWFDDLEVGELFWQTNKPKEVTNSLAQRKSNSSYKYKNSENL